MNTPRTDAERMRIQDDDKKYPEQEDVSNAAFSWAEKLETELAEATAQAEELDSKLTHVLTSQEEGTLPYWQKKHDKLLMDWVHASCRAEKAEKACADKDAVLIDLRNRMNSHGRGSCGTYLRG